MRTDFLTGFAVGAQISDPTVLRLAYWRWRESTELNEVELIDLEGGGYATGVEVGQLYRKQQQTNN